MKNGGNPYIKNNIGETILMRLVSYSRRDILEFLLEYMDKDLNKTDFVNFINAQDIEGRTALYIAAGRDLITIKLLLQYNADPYVNSKKHDILLSRALINKKYDIVKYLLEYGMKIDSSNLETPLNYATMPQEIYDLLMNY